MNTCLNFLLQNFNSDHNYKKGYNSSAAALPESWSMEQTLIDCYLFQLSVNWWLVS